jgi:hypothetical protein
MRAGARTLEGPYPARPHSNLRVQAYGTACTVQKAHQNQLFNQKRTLHHANAACALPLKLLNFSPKNGLRTVRLLSCHHNRKPKRTIRLPSTLRRGANHQTRA